MKMINRESLAKEARKFKTVEEFIQSIRLPSMIEIDTARLIKMNKLNKKEAVRIYDSLEEFNRNKNIVKRNIRGAKQELKRLNMLENKLRKDAIDLLKNVVNLLPDEGGWFKRATVFFNEVNKA